MDVLDDGVVEDVATVQWDCGWTMPIEHDGKGFLAVLRRGTRALDTEERVEEMEFRCERGREDVASRG